MIRNTSSVVILDAAIATGAGRKHTPRQLKRTFQVEGNTSAGAGTATVAIEVSNTPVPAVDGDWIVLATVTLLASPVAPAKESDGFTTDAPWRHVRANMTAITGTDHKVTVRMGG